MKGLQSSYWALNAAVAREEFLYLHEEVSICI